MKKFCNGDVRLYHCMPLSAVSYNVLHPDRQFSDSELLPAYLWLEERIGFYPLFLALGQEDSISMTGYTNQWKRVVGCERRHNGSITNVYRRKGEFPNDVLFGFDKAVLAALDAVFTDYSSWLGVLNCIDAEAKRIDEQLVGERLLKSLFKCSWSAGRWLSCSFNNPNAVQVLVPQLDLRLAREVWVRNQTSARRLCNMGFANVKVRRLSARE